MALSIEWITDEDRFVGLAEQWDRLLPHDSAPFDRHCWYEAWWFAFGRPGNLSVCAAWREDELAAVLPLVRRPRGRLQAMANVHTPIFRPLGADQEALEAVATAAASEEAASLEAPALPFGDRSLPILRTAARDARMLEVLEPLHVSPIVETRGTHEHWREATKPRWGTSLESLRRKMAREHDARFELVEEPVDLERALQRGFEVEASGWKGARGTAVLSAPETARFYRSVATAFYRLGELRLSGVELDGRLAAFDLSLLHRNRLYLLKTGYDEAFRRLAPGLVLRLSVIECCFELGLDAHELLGDDSAWKRKFSNAERRHVALRAYARRPLPLARFGYRSIARPVLKRVRTSLTRGGEPSRGSSRGQRGRSAVAQSQSGR